MSFMGCFLLALLFACTWVGILALQHQITELTKKINGE